MLPFLLRRLSLHRSSRKERDKLRAHLEVNQVGRCAIAKFRFPDAQWVKPEIARAPPRRDEISAMEQCGGFLANPWLAGVSLDRLGLLQKWASASAARFAERTRRRLYGTR
jgi:hypothetical protein